MSLIQEALKRQHKDPTSKAAEAAGAAATPPPVPPPPPAATPLKFKPQKPGEEAADAGTAPATTVIGAESAAGLPPMAQEGAAGRGAEARGLLRKPVVIAGIAVAALVLVGGIIWAVKMLLPGKKPTEETQPPVANVAAPATTKKPETAKPTSNATVAAKPAEVPKPAPVPTVATQKPQPIPAKPVPAPTPAPVPAAPTGVSLAPPAAAVVSPPAPKKEVVRWPILLIKGILKGGQGGGGAIINNDIVEVGKEIDGVKVISVNANGTVTLEYKGERKMLRSGEIAN